MKTFSYFLFENFDADLESDNPCNPRRIINTQADAILSRVADFPPLTCPAIRLQDEFGAEAVRQLVTAGVFREENGQIAYDTPIFLEEDVPALKIFLPVRLEYKIALFVTEIRMGSKGCAYGRKTS